MEDVGESHGKPPADWQAVTSIVTEKCDRENEHFGLVAWDTRGKLLSQFLMGFSDQNEILN